VLVGIGPAGPPPAPPPGAVADPVVRTVTVHGRAGSFGSLVGTLPSGQPLGHRVVAEWETGRLAGPAAVAADGTVLLASGTSDPGVPPAGAAGGAGPPGAAPPGAAPPGAAPPGAAPAGPTVTAYRPATGRVATISLPAPAEPPPAGYPAPAVTHLAPIAGGQAVAFTTGPAYPGDPAPSHGWPVLGILTEVDGGWRVAGGDGWRNQWTGGELRASQPPHSQRACPEEPGAPGQSGCRGLGELVGLPASGHLIVAQAGSPGWYNGQLMALRLTGPDPAGRFTVAVAGSYLYPNVRDPETGDYLDLEFHALQADPTGRIGDERFVVGLRDLDPDGDRPLVIQEFRYDAATGRIDPVSAPALPGDRAGPDGPLYGYSATVYDQHGNLWAARHQWLAGGSLAVHLGGLGCKYDPQRPPEAYRTTAGGRTAWGQACPPDYDLRQARELAAVVNLARNPAGGEVVALGLAGQLLPVRASAQGGELRFEIGNLVETGLRLLPAPPGASVAHRPGGFDPGGQLWLPAGQVGAGPAGGPAEQWLYQVAVADLFDPDPVPLPEVPGRLATIQAGHTVSTGTGTRAGPGATTEVISHAHLRACTEGSSSVGCSYDGLPGDGFMLGDPSGFGHLGGEVGYPVEVPVAGRYRVAYRVLTFEPTTGAEIVLSAGGRTYRTPVDTQGRWETVPVAEPVGLPAGVHTIRVSPPEGGGGWYLSFVTLQRA
jgi:hypothetical protein